MKNNSLRIKSLFTLFMTLTIILGLVACGGNTGVSSPGTSDSTDSSAAKLSGAETSATDSGPEGTFYNTQRDQDDGKGFQATDELMNYGYMTFNSDGTGKWEYGLETKIEWKLKGDQLTIVERWVDVDHKDQEETYPATWDGEKVILSELGYKYLFEKTDTLPPNSSSELTDPSQGAQSPMIGLYKCTGSDMQGTKLDPADEWLDLMEDGRGKWFLGATEDTFAWTLNGSEINFDVDVANSDIKMPYTATIDEENIILDTGMLYYFTKKANVSQVDPAPIENEITSIEGEWKCIEMTMEQLGSILDTEKLEEIYEMKADQILRLTVFADGTGEMIFWGEETEIVWVGEADKNYIIQLAYDGEADDSIVLKGGLEHNNLILQMIETYTDDNEEIESILRFVLEHQ